MNDERSEAGSTWMESEGAREHVTRLLAQSGAPLEARIARFCRRFVGTNHSQDGCHISAQPLVYGLDLERPLREIDQIVTFYEEIDVGDLLGIQLILNVPIEAKSRKGIQLFGIPVGSKIVSSGALPISGHLAYSNVVRQRIATQLPIHMADGVISRITALKFTDDGTPHSVSDEKLINNAAASLYDFIVESTDADQLSTLKLEDNGVLQDFDNYLQANHYAHEFVARAWARSVPYETVKTYVESVTGGRRVHRSVEIYCPVICMDSPMHEVTIDDRGIVSSFSTSDSITTSTRIVGWKSSARGGFSVRGPEAVTTVTTPAGLEALLPDLLRLHTSAKEELLNLENEQADRAVFEHDFIAAVRTQYDAPESYRSDLDFTDY